MIWASASEMTNTLYTVRGYKRSCMMIKEKPQSDLTTSLPLKNEVTVSEDEVDERLPAYGSKRDTEIHRDYNLQFDFKLEGFRSSRQTSNKVKISMMPPKSFQ